MVVRLIPWSFRWRVGHGEEREVEILLEEVRKRERCMYTVENYCMLMVFGFFEFGMHVMLVEYYELKG